MKITEEWPKVVLKKHIVSAAFHPCTSSLLMATGNLLGNVGLWKLGSVCCMDVEKAVFDD
ncbi:hypothetical protein FQN60_010722, partial [Etheostoma spectabile]